jgi:hypothetical protein
MEPESFSETVVNICKTTWYHVQKTTSFLKESTYLRKPDAEGRLLTRKSWNWVVYPRRGFHKTPWADRKLIAFQNNRVQWCQLGIWDKKWGYVCITAVPARLKILYPAQGQHFTDSIFLSMIWLPLASQWDGTLYITTEFVASPDHPAMRYLTRICFLEQVVM